MKLFTPEDFAFTNEHRNEEAARFANEKLERIAKDWPVVYGLRNGPDKNDWMFASGFNKGTDTHTARLFNIEELPKAECMHEPEELIHGDADGLVYAPTCRHCGVELVAEWKAK